MKQEQENEVELYRLYNEGVLKRDGSPDISRDKSTPAAPRKYKVKILKLKNTDKAKKKKLPNEYIEDEKPV